MSTTLARVTCAEDGCRTHLECDPRHALNLTDARWRCHEHRKDTTA